MSSKSERERRRAERIASEKAEAESARRRLMVGYAAAGALTLAVVVGIVVVIGSGGSSENQVNGQDIPATAHIQVRSGFLHNTQPDGREGTAPPALQQGDLKTAAKAANCELRRDLPDEGNTHITKESQIPDYGTNPPTSGNHNPEQLADGAYAVMPQPWYFVHSLEHGRIEIQYSPISGVRPTGAQGCVRRESRRDADVPEHRDALRGRRNGLDAVARLQAVRGARDSGRDPRLPRHLSRPGPRAAADHGPRLSRGAPPARAGRRDDRPAPG